MAIGEAACVSVHGANRLGSNSLLDIIVFGRAAAQRCVELIKPGSPLPTTSGDNGSRALDRLDGHRHAKGSVPTAQLRLEMQRIMQSNCAVFRTGEILTEGHELLAGVWDRQSDIKVTDRSMIWNSDLAETLEFDNLLAQSIVSLDGALNRTESRGGHSREDFPDRDDDNWMKHTLAWLDGGGKTRFDYCPVRLNTMSNDVQTFPPKARVY